MKNYIIEKFNDYSKSNDKVKAIYFVKEENNNEHFANIYAVYSDIIISKIKEDLENIFNDYALINKRKDYFKHDKKNQQFTKFEIYTNDSTKIGLTIISLDLAGDFIKLCPGNIEFISDQINLKEEVTDNKEVYKLPRGFEFDEASKNFYSLALDVSFYLMSRDMISAGFKMQAMRDELFKLLNWYIIDKFNRAKDAGEFGENLIHTLEADIKEDVLMTFGAKDIGDIYNSIFKACQLYRRIGMELADKFDFTYPKRDDVYTLKLLRKNYKKMESLEV
ncbi:aminoglycoside 6-adenylyltransferase [Anaerococcus hydrogenalis]|uniref:aminoglycoside 6-adenylyltransferase n=1 Tax=Anaerococcus hydrogenalis TaxID=33029 RepID=UPI001D7D7C8F|nr:aminoglycoside 6-adenylyltransferase [Anaerococcus hydrogenalis]MBS5989147.1 aminoglycoside 6-adenylyltransferase [Anaerococcus hydrogenalis]